MLMKVNANQIEQHVKKTLSPVYLFTGEEPLLLQEALQQVRDVAKQQGYLDREVFHAETGFDWSEFMVSSQSMGLFATKRLIDLRLKKGKPGTAGAKAIVDYCAQIPTDTILLISSDVWEKGSRNAKWIKSIDSVGVIVQAWPVDVKQLPAWITKKMQSKGMQADRDAVQALVARVEGNLLAASQEIEKLYLLYGSTTITEDDVLTCVADSARYDIYQLVDVMLSGNAVRALKMLAQLKAEDMQPTLLLWAISKEVRLLCRLSAAVKAFPQANIGQLMAKAGVWDKRKPIIRQALERLSASEWHQLLADCAHIDKSIKGLTTDDVWIMFESIIAKVSGYFSTKQAMA